MMRREPLFTGEKQKMSIILDSQSTEQVMVSSKEDLQRLLTYINIDIFDFLRTPFISDSQVLAKVIQFEKEFDAKGIISAIKLQKSPNHEFRILFPYELLQPETLAKQIFDKQ